MSNIVVEGLSVHYDGTPVLWDVNFQIPEGVIVSVIGPNGAGKTTLLKCMLGLIRPISGLVTFGSRSLHEVRKKISYVGQRSEIDWDFPITVFELVLMGVYGKLGVFGWPSNKDRMRARQALDQLGMLAYADRQINDLSGGQQQRVFLARALVQEADYYFFDEPFAGVDLATERDIVALFRKLKSEGKTLIVVHHDLQTVQEYFDWVIMMNTRLIASGPANEVYTQENLEKLYGERGCIFEEVLKLAGQKTGGL